MSLESRWNALTPSTETEVFQLYDPTHPLDFYIGRDIQGQRLLLLVTSDQPPVSKELRAIRWQTFKRDDGKWSLVFRLTNTELSPLFSLLCEDLIECGRRIPDPTRPIGPLMKRFYNWQRMLEKGHFGLLQESELRGLCGELVALERVMVPALGLLESVRSWVGQESADQDFQIADKAWEVKTIRSDSKAVRISSEDQLCSISRSIQLLVVQLDERLAGELGVFTPNELVVRIRALLEPDPDALDIFDQRLLSAGYVVRPEYDQRFFLVARIHGYRVDENFPHIRRSMLMPGVAKVTYDVSLEACKPFLLEKLPVVEG